MLQDKISIEQLNKKDIDAFHILYTKYYKALVLYSIQFLGSIDIAEDIVQDLFSSLWETNNEIQSIITLQNYLYTSVRNSSLDYLKHKHVQDKYIKYALSEMQEQSNNYEDEEDFHEEEVYRRIFDTINELPARCREVFLLYMKGKKNEEIATSLKISAETVKTQKKRAMKVLRKISFFLQIL